MKSQKWLKSIATHYYDGCVRVVSLNLVVIVMDGGYLHLRKPKASLIMRNRNNNLLLDNELENRLLYTSYHQYQSCNI